MQPSRPVSGRRTFMCYGRERDVVRCPRKGVGGGGGYVPSAPRPMPAHFSKNGDYALSVPFSPFSLLAHWGIVVVLIGISDWQCLSPTAGGVSSVEVNSHREWC